MAQLILSHYQKKARSSRGGWVPVVDLGLGDFHSRIEPYEVTALSNKCVMQVAAATWHSAAVVCVPPMQGSGWVYTWGSGYHGQLAHGRTQVQTTPTVVEALRSRNLSAVSIRLGSHHSAMIAMDGELCIRGARTSTVVWAMRSGTSSSNIRRTRATRLGLGPSWKGWVEAWSATTRSGESFTIVATYPYEGPTEDVARKLMEEEAIRLDMLALEDEQDAATLRGSQAGTQDDGTLATGEDDMTMDDESIMSGGGGRGGPAGILDKGAWHQKRGNNYTSATSALRLAMSRVSAGPAPSGSSRRRAYARGTRPLLPSGSSRTFRLRDARRLQGKAGIGPGQRARNRTSPSDSSGLSNLARRRLRERFEGLLPFSFRPRLLSNSWRLHRKNRRRRLAARLVRVVIHARRPI